MKDTKINLCDTCGNNYPECDVPIVDLEFGDGVGNDNVIVCSGYVDISCKRAYSPETEMFKGEI